ncbi:MAG: ATP-binding cassette domain-containing protein [Candidatus Absconditabacterales bacterium]
MAGNQNSVILRFDDVSFAYNDGRHPILIDSDFSIRENTKITIMGQNGAGKTTIFKMITGELTPQKGKINIIQGKTIAISRQVIPRDQLGLSIKEFFETAFKEKDYQIDRKITEVLNVVNFNAPMNKPIKEFSGGQQARLLLAYALIQHPDILLLDEPTNNLDGTGIGDLITFLLSYDKTVVVISHDADFLNLFTDGVLYLNRGTNKVEQYWGDYYDVVEQIAAQIEKDQMQNARAEKKIVDAKEKINFFSNKGGKMRKLASKMRDEVEEAEENKVEVRKDDKTITGFSIPFENYVGPIVTINKVGLMNAVHEVVNHKLPLVIKKHDRYMFVGPNGIGKSTLLKRLMMIHEHKAGIMKEYKAIIEDKTKDIIIKEPDTTHPEEEIAMIHNKVKVGYYSQDFDALDMNKNVRDTLEEVAEGVSDQDIYRVAAQFLITKDLFKNSVGSLSEGQKGLLCYARFVLQKPHLLILDEPTNHINFRHLPVIAQSLNKYEGAMIMVSHDKGFTDQLENLHIIDLGKLLK